MADTGESRPCAGESDKLQLPHRDPETGKFRPHDDEMTRDLTYADHEFVNFRLLSQITDDSGDSDGSEQIKYLVEDTVLNLDNDELAMLTSLNAAISVSVTGFSQDQDSNGVGHVTGEVGANLSDADYTGERTEFESVTLQDSTINARNIESVANDEPGLWGLLTATTAGGFKDLSGDGGYYSGGSSTSRDRLDRVFYEETMSGPYIDNTDDINAGMYIRKDSMGAEVQAQMIGQMAFVIYEYDQRRAEFGPVPGGT